MGILGPMKTTTFAAAVLLLAFALKNSGVNPPGSPNTGSPDSSKGPALDTSFLKQYAETRGFMLGRPQKPKVTPDGKSVLFLRADGKTPKLALFEFDVAAGKTRELLSPASLLKGAEENLSPEEKARRERQRVSVGGFTDFHLDPTGGRVLVKLSNRLFVLDRAAGKATELKTGEGGAIIDPKWSPDGTRVAYVRGFDVYAFDLAGNKESPVTTGGTQVKTHGLAEFVAQEEMHRDSGFWWSPDGKHIAYEEADHTGVETWYVADPFKPDVKPAEQYYPRPGKKNVTVRLGVIPVSGGETVWVEWDRTKYEYLAVVRWDEFGPLTLQLQDRKQQHLALLKVDAESGKTTILIEQSNASWLNIDSETPRWFADKGSFFYRSQEGPLPNLFYWQHEPKSPRMVELLGNAAGGRDGLRDLLAFNPSTRLFGYTASADPTQQHVFYGVWDEDGPGEGEPHVQLSNRDGVHTAAFGQSLNTFVVTSTTLKELPVSLVGRHDRHGNKRESLGHLPSVAAEPPFVPNVTIQKVGDYWTGIVRPRDFDPKKKYPVVVFTYGGPTSQVVTQAMQPWLIRQWLADQGFVVVAIDNRGTAGRGREWEKALYQKFGTVPLEDQVKGLKALCDKHRELDRDRVGIVGWSFGGYMAANAVLREPEVFKAAVAGAPVTDWEDYDTHYTERYMGLLPESKAAYDEASLLPLAKNLRRPLLLVHGTADDNVYYRHTLKLSNELVRAGRDFEVLPLPGITHMITSDPVVMERFWGKTATFFQRHLGGPK
jgi:dipeptidyl-peptidase-4